MKMISINVMFKDDADISEIGIGKGLGGGKVTAMSIYDVFAAHEIAVEALEEAADLGEEHCIAAMEQIHEIPKQWV